MSFANQQTTVDLTETLTSHATTFMDLIQVTENGITRERMYLSKEDVRSAVNAYGAKNNIVFSTKSSGEYAITLVCKHSGAYRVPNSVTYETETAKRVKRSQKVGCGCFIKAKPSKMGGCIFTNRKATTTIPVPKEETCMLSTESNLKK